MTRPRKTDAPDPKRAIELTVGAIERLQPPATGQIFLRDTRQPGLKVRCTAAGAKSYVHEGKLAAQTLRITIGDVRTWELQAARAEARRLACLIDQNRDPRELARQEAAAREAAARAAKLAQTSARDAWNAYVSERRPRWSEAHARDHERKAAPGGEPIRGGGVTQPGPLCALLSLPLRELDSERITRWAQAEAQRRPTSARLSLRLLHSFLNWARECPEYRDLGQR